MPDRSSSPPDASRPKGILAGLRIRKKLIVLHTSFSLALAVLLIVAMRPALGKVIVEGEQAQARLIGDLLRATGLDAPERLPGPIAHDRAGRVTIASGDPTSLGLSGPQVSLLRELEEAGRGDLPLPSNQDGAGIVLLTGDTALVVRTRNTSARRAVSLVYALLIVSLLAGYAFVAAALEAVVLPRHVYSPIRAMLEADDAVRRGDRAAEFVPKELIPADELGEIMRSRNESIASMRRHEDQLAAALTRLEETAVDLRKKNHLLEAARRNLEGADRLASLGMMSAGIAHELNTPLAVVKGLVDKLAGGQDLSATERALLARVVGRLEKLSEGLLDFARVRPPRLESASLRTIVEEAWTLVRLDRTLVQPGSTAELVNAVPESLSMRCDADRLVQVFVNLIRNALGVIRDAGTGPARVVVSAQAVVRDAEDWLTITVADNGPGIAPEVIERLFEPFYSTRLDSHGTGLGLAVSEGIVGEHGGVLVARNASDDDRRRDPGLTGAVFEILLPRDPAGLFGTIE
jgi:C4-dicarboxylate-specific signal transduction histidine kinase